MVNAKLKCMQDKQVANRRKPFGANIAQAQRTDTRASVSTSSAECGTQLRAE
jgi:hypothetical protein